MNNNSQVNNEKDLTTLHICYLGGLLVEGIKNFHSDVATYCPEAPDVLQRKSYRRMIELRDKFERAVLININKE